MGNFGITIKSSNGDDHFTTLAKLKAYDAYLKKIYYG